MDRWHVLGFVGCRLSSSRWFPNGRDPFLDAGTSAQVDPGSTFVGRKNCGALVGPQVSAYSGPGSQGVLKFLGQAVPS